MQTQRRKIQSIAAIVLAALPLGVLAQDESAAFTAQQIEAGASLYERNCAPCHGPHMADPEGAFDLRKFPPDQRARFFNSVTNGKNSMPPWGGLFSQDEIGTLWAYVVAGEKR